MVYVTNTATMRNTEVCPTDLELKYKSSLKECGKDDADNHSVLCENSNSQCQNK
jgi:hypothetical protein